MRCPRPQKLWLFLSAALVVLALSCAGKGSPRPGEACVKCHLPEVAGLEKIFAGRTPPDCAACHGASEAHLDSDGKERSDRIPSGEQILAALAPYAPEREGQKRLFVEIMLSHKANDKPAAAP